MVVSAVGASGTLPRGMRIRPRCGYRVDHRRRRLPVRTLQQTIAAMRDILRFAPVETRWVNLSRLFETFNRYRHWRHVGLSSELARYRTFYANEW